MSLRWRVAVLGLLGLLWGMTGCRGADPEARRELESRGLRVEAATLVDCSRQGDLVGVRQLLAAGVPVDGRDAFGRTGLHAAAWGKHAEVLRLLLSSGASVDARDRLERTPLALAAARSAVDEARLLLDGGAGASARDQQGVTPLERAVWVGDAALTRLLVDRQADVRGMDTEGYTALHCAAYRGDTASMELLLSRGADIDAARSGGSTPLQVALLPPNHVDAVALLVGKGARVDVRDENGTTPLHRAAWDGNPRLLALLLGGKIDCNPRDVWGATPLHRVGNKDIAPSARVARMLLDRGAELNALTHAGETPLDVARQRGLTRVAKVLVSRGGQPGPGAKAAPDEATVRKRLAAIPLPPAVEPPPRRAQVDALRRRLCEVLAQGRLPIIDTEFHLTPLVTVEDLLDLADQNDVALTWVGPAPRSGSAVSTVLAEAFPQRFVPVTVHGQEIDWIRGSPELLAQLARDAASGRYFALGEFECHRNCGLWSDRYTCTPADSPQMDFVCTISERYGLPVLMHQEYEDRLLPQVERLLDRHPRAVLVWCHGGRYGSAQGAARLAQVETVASLLRRHPNLHFNLINTLTMGGAAPHDAIVREPGTRRVRLTPEWRDLIVAFPDRFVLDTDASNIRIAWYSQIIGTVRAGILENLPPEVAWQVAYGNAWRLMTGEALPPPGLPASGASPGAR